MTESEENAASRISADPTASPDEPMPPKEAQTLPSEPNQTDAEPKESAAAIEARNRLNASMSPGEVRGGGAEFFTLDDIRRMSRAEVREQYEAVLRSLERSSR